MPTANRAFLQFETQRKGTSSLKNTSRQGRKYSRMITLKGQMQWILRATYQNCSSLQQSYKRKKSPISWVCWSLYERRSAITFPHFPCIEAAPETPFPGPIAREPFRKYVSKAGVYKTYGIYNHLVNSTLETNCLMTILPLMMKNIKVPRVYGSSWWARNQIGTFTQMKIMKIMLRSLWPLMQCGRIMNQHLPTLKQVELQVE